jgi:hypothetical protein
MGGLTTDVPTLRWYAWLTGRAAMLVPVNVRCGSQQKVPRHTAMVLMTWQRPLLVAKLSLEMVLAPSHQYTLQVVYTPTPFRLPSLRL